MLSSSRVSKTMLSPTVSVLIVAHNEARYIRRCLQSVLAQTRHPDEIIVVAHNCSDDTATLAAEFDGVQIIELTGPPGVVFARIRGFNEATGDIVASLDGDSWAAPRWLENLVRPLVRYPAAAAAGGWVVFWGRPLAFLMSLDFFWLKRLYSPDYWFYFWGSNFACRRMDYRRVGGLVPLVGIRNQLELHYWADDLYLALKLRQLGNILFIRRAVVYSVARWGSPL
ncbi:MAG: glycosyltransferase family A protein, partial [bacterium]